MGNGACVKLCLKPLTPGEGEVALLGLFQHNLLVVEDVYCRRKAPHALCCLNFAVFI